MNWKASLFGALIVMLVGAGVGVAVGAKPVTHTHTTTLTVARTVTSTVTTAAATTPTTTSTTSGTTSTGQPSGGSTGQYYSDYLSKQNTNQLDTNATNVSLDGTAPSLQLAGQNYQHAVAFDLSVNGPNIQQLSYQLPVPGFKHFSAKVAGLATNTAANSSYKLTIFKDADKPGASVLYSATFTGPSGTHAVSFDLKGAVDIVLDWTMPPSGEPGFNQDQFIFADPVVTQ